MALDDYSKYLATQNMADHEGCLLHLRIDGVQPFTLPKLNYDGRTGRCDATPSEAIELLPYQTLTSSCHCPHACSSPTSHKTPKESVLSEASALSITQVNHRRSSTLKQNQLSCAQATANHMPAHRGWTAAANPSPTYPQPHQRYQPSLSYRPAATSQPISTRQSNSPSKKTTPSTHPHYTSLSKSIGKLPNGNNNNNKTTPQGTCCTSRPNTPAHWPRKSSTHSIQQRQYSRSAVEEKKTTTKKWPNKVIRTSTWSQHTQTLKRPVA